MKTWYSVSGMTCVNCASRVKSALLKHPEVLSAHVDHQQGEASVETHREIPEKDLRALVSETGEYKITGKLSKEKSPEKPSSETSDVANEPPISTWEVYKPLVLIFLFVAGVAANGAYDAGTFSWMKWMQFFMGGFFLVFSFFKFLDMKGFARSYAMYDLLAKQWKGYGYVYPFLELGLGVLYLTAIHLPATHVATIVIMGFSSIGVIRNLLSPNQVQCACLGTIFKLPLGRVTLVEDLLMVAMAFTMFML